MLDGWKRRGWYLWDDTRWREDSTLTVYDRVRGLCRRAAEAANDERQARQLRRAPTVAAIEKLAKSDRRYAGTIEQWDIEPWSINPLGGIVNLRTGALGAHNPDAEPNQKT
jgi:putative DNA primase/helicase